MTIDERLEAITQTLELVAGMQLVNEKSIAANEKAIAELARIVAPIAQLVLAHEQRLKRLEEPGTDPPSPN